MDIYLDNAATSHPKPQAVIDEVCRALSDYNANPGRSGHSAALEAARRVYAARASLSAFLHAESGSSMSFTGPPMRKLVWDESGSQSRISSAPGVMPSVS